jgi:hypothetical protein
MIKPFIRDEHVGFICIHFTDTDDRTRWGVSRSWKAVGEYTLARSETLVDRGACAAEGLTFQEGITKFLATLVVEAAIEGYRNVLPCRSYALMEAFGSSYLLIEASRVDGTVHCVRALPVSSAAEADEMIDAIEEDLGHGTARCGIDAAGNAFTLIPILVDEVLPTGDELTRGLPRRFAGRLAEVLDDPHVRAQLLDTMQSRGPGGPLNVH